MIYGDPEFLPFNEPDRIKYYKYAPNSYVTINGRDLNRVCRERDVIGKLIDLIRRRRTDEGTDCYNC